MTTGTVNAMAHISRPVNRMLSSAGPKSSDASPPSRPVPVFDCPTCKDRGYVIRRDVPVGDPAFGKAIPCPDCAEKRQAARVAQLQQLEGWLRDATFETFDVTSKNREAFDKALRFAKKPVGLYTMRGEHGPGKTHLLATIDNSMTARGVSSLFTTLPDLVSQHKAAISRNDTEGFYQMVSRYRVLLIDEIDKANLTDWTMEQTFRLFNRRYNLATELGTAMTMNKDPRVYDGPMGYLFSRMLDERAMTAYLEGDNRPMAGSLRKLAEITKKAIKR